MGMCAQNKGPSEVIFDKNLSTAKRVSASKELNFDIITCGEFNCYPIREFIQCDVERTLTAILSITCKLKYAKAY